MKGDDQKINQDTGNPEYYTPPEITQAARLTMGGIDLDPASCNEANRKVGAAKFFTKKDNAIGQAWHGRVWMNHPFNRGWKACDQFCNRAACKNRGFHIFENIPSNQDWICKLEMEYTIGRIVSACCITFANTSEAWFLPLFRRPQCWIFPRTKYYLPGGAVAKNVPKGSVVSYFGADVDLFYRHFHKLGKITIPYKGAENAKR